MICNFLNANKMLCLGENCRPSLAHHGRFSFHDLWQNINSNIFIAVRHQTKVGEYIIIPQLKSFKSKIQRNISILEVKSFSRWPFLFTLRSAPTASARSVLFITNKSLCVIPGPPLRGTLSPPTVQKYASQMIII